jgi:hypothetical protein
LQDVEIRTLLVLVVTRQNGLLRLITGFGVAFIGRLGPCHWGRDPEERPNSNARSPKARFGSKAADQVGLVVELIWCLENFWRDLATSHDSHSPVGGVVHRASV